VKYNGQYKQTKTKQNQKLCMLQNHHQVQAKLLTKRSIQPQLARIYSDPDKLGEMNITILTNQQDISSNNNS
jgi:uncharacterized protein YueI